MEQNQQKQRDNQHQHQQAGFHNSHQPQKTDYSNKQQYSCQLCFQVSGLISHNQNSSIQKTNISNYISHLINHKKQIEKLLLSSQNILLQTLNSFPQIKSLTPQCTNVLFGSCKVYRCKDCLKQDNSVLCQPCFKNISSKIPNHSQIHTYEVKQLSPGKYDGLCDCGNQQMCHIFCEYHTGKQQTQNNIIQKTLTYQAKLFKDTIFSLYILLFNLLNIPQNNQESKKLFIQVNKKIVKLIANSQYYTLLTAQILCKPNLYQNFNIAYALLGPYLQYFDENLLALFLNLFSNCSKYRKDIFRQIIKSYNKITNLNYHKNFKRMAYQTLFRSNIYNQLAKQQNLVIEPASNPQYFLDLSSMIQHQNTVPIEVIKCLVNKKFIVKNLQILILFYKDNNYQFCLLLLTNFLIHLRKFNQKQYISKIIKQIIQVNLEGIQIDALSYFFQAIIMYSGKLENQIKYTEIFKQIQLDQQNLKKFMKSITPYLISKQQIINNQFYKWFKVIQEFEWKDQLIQFFIFTATSKYTNKQQFFRKIQIFNSIYRKIKLKNYFILYTYSKYKIKSQQIFQKSSITLHNILYQIQKKNSLGLTVQIVNLSVKKIFGQFKQQLQQFVTKNLKFDQKKSVYHLIKKQKMNEQIDQIQLKNLCKKLFNKEIVISFIAEFIAFSQNQKDVQIQANNDKLSNALFFMLRIYNVLREDSPNQLCVLVQKLEQIKKKLFTSMSQYNKNILKQQFGFQFLFEQNQQENMIMSKKQNAKIKIQKIKNKKFEELRKKQQNFIDNIKQEIGDKQEKQAQNNQNQDICLLCHQQSQRQKDLLVCFINISTTNILSLALQSNDNEIQITQCGHQVHQSCFMKSFGQTGYFNCPLCKSVSNCVIPINQNKIHKKQQTNLWKTRMQTFLALKFAQKIYSIFQILIRFIIYSQSLKILINQSQYHMKKRLKVENIIIKTLNQLVAKQIQQRPSIREEYENILDNLQAQYKKQKSKNQIKTLLKINTLKLIRKNYFENKFQNENKINQQKLFNDILQRSLMKWSISLKKWMKQDTKKLQQLQSIINNVQEKKLSLNQNRQNQQESQQSQYKKQIIDWNREILPLQASQFIKKYGLKCIKCNQDKETAWKCLLCKQTGCNSCLESKQHIKQKHDGNGMTIFLKNGELHRYFLNRLIESKSIYQNIMKQNLIRIKGSQGFKLNQQIINQWYLNFLMGQTPKVLNKIAVVRVMNGQMI